MATKLWTSSRLITTNLGMVGNALISSKASLEHCCNALKHVPTHFGHIANMFTFKDSVGGSEGVWLPNSGHHVVSSRQIWAWLEMLMYYRKNSFEHYSNALIMSPLILATEYLQAQNNTAVSLNVCLQLQMVCMFSCLCG